MEKFIQPKRITVWLVSLAVCQLVAGALAAAEPAPKWESLFDGKSLAGWKITPFGGEGEVHVDDGQIVLEMGADLTGITIARDVPKIDYELELEAMRVDGIDFFCGLTFPVNDKPCSLIVGGWAGAVVGLSSLDGLDASENETTKLMSFKNETWYKIRLRVTADYIQAWIDDEPVVDCDIAGRELSIRVEVDPSRPLGIATWQTVAALRAIRVRALGEDEK